jgi:putative spermidine/putrescine transport system substrate-binding protein
LWITFYGKELKERYDITLNRVPIADTADAVNQVLSEKQAGKDPGAVDLIWINGENFFTLKQADMLYPIGRRNSPTARWSTGTTPPSISILVIRWKTWKAHGRRRSSNSSTIRRAPAKMNFPRSYAELKIGLVRILVASRTSRPDLAVFSAHVLSKGALYELSGGAEQWQTFDQAAWDQWSPALWTYLNELEPCLWRNGETYPKDESELSISLPTTKWT